MGDPWLRRTCASERLRMAIHELYHRARGSRDKELLSLEYESVSISLLYKMKPRSDRGDQGLAPQSEDTNPGDVVDVVQIPMRSPDKSTQ